MKTKQPKKYQTPPSLPGVGNKAATDPATPALFAPALDLVKIGFDAGVKAFNTRTWKPLEEFVADANSSDMLLRRNGLSALYGAALGLADTLTAAHSSGRVKIAGAIPTRGAIEYAFKTDVRRFDSLLQIILGTANRVMDAVPSMTATIKREDAKAAEPVAVRVVGMPARETTSKVRRDEQGNIVSSTAIEMDTTV